MELLDPWFSHLQGFWYRYPPNSHKPWEPGIWNVVTSYHIWVEGWSQPLVVQVIPVYGAEEYMILYVKLQEEGDDRKQPSP